MTLECSTLELWTGSTIREFLEIVLRKKRVLRATGTWHRVRFSADMPFGRGPTLVALVEEEDGVTALAVLPIRASFDEEEQLAAWPEARYLFTTWRRMLHGGQLVRALDELANALDGDFDRLPARLAGVRRDVRADAAMIESLVENVHLATAGYEVEGAADAIRQAFERVAPRAQELSRCRFLDSLRRYMELADDQG